MIFENGRRLLNKQWSGTRGIVCRNASIGMMPKYFIASQPSRRSLPGSAGRTGCPLASSAIGPYSYGILEKVLVDGGFITAADMRYHFFVTDHLANVRVVVNDAGVVEQVNRFYPYGETSDMGQALPGLSYSPRKVYILRGAHIVCPV